MGPGNSTLTGALEIQRVRIGRRHHRHHSREGIRIMMSAKPSRVGATAFLLAILVIAATLGWEGSHPARSQENEEWQSVVLIYHSDVKGKIEPCG
jgi:hypothetical protein